MDGPEHIEALKKFLDRRGEVYKLKRSLFAEIGRTVVAQSNVEYNLLILFEMISTPLTDVESLAVYKKKRRLQTEAEFG